MTAFLDTNILLHYPPLRDLNWKALCNAESVKLVICMQVIHELDEMKGHPHLADRARRAIKEIRELSSAGCRVRDDVELEIFACEIRREDFPATLSPESGDDRIVWLAKKYAADRHVEGLNDRA
jgi:predicted ribonuclease YlaK